MKLARKLCFLAGVLLVPVLVQACLIDCSITISGSDGTYAKVGIDDVKNVVVDEKGTSWFEFTLPETAGGESVLEKLVLKVNNDPEVGIEFGVRAGSVDTTYNILSGAVTFAPLSNAVGEASAGITLTDKLAPGATVTGLFSGGKAHQARYNGTSLFASLVNGVSVTQNTVTTSENYPGSGTVLINDTLTSIESEFWFKLSAGDSASGTSTFIVTPIPEPATLLILGFGVGSVLLRRTK